MGSAWVVGWLSTYCAVVWADPTWAYDASWLSSGFSFTGRPCARRASGSRRIPAQVSPEARIMTWFPWELRVTSDRTTMLMPRNYNPRRIKEVIGQYGVTHFLWGSFEPPPYHEINPESWAVELDHLRTTLGLTESARSIVHATRFFFPVRLYRLP